MKRQRDWPIFLSAPMAPPLKNKNKFYCRLAVAEGSFWGKFGGNVVGFRIFSVPQPMQRAKKLNLERQDWKNQAFNTEWFLAITSITGPKSHNFNFSPVYSKKMTPEKNPLLVWVFFTFQCFVLFLIFASASCLSFSSFPLLLDFLKPKSGPSKEVIGIFFNREWFSFLYLSHLLMPLFLPFFSKSLH